LTFYLKTILQVATDRARTEPTNVRFDTGGAGFIGRIFMGFWRINYFAGKKLKI